MNVIVDDDEDPTPDDLVRPLRQQWARVRLLDTDGWVDRNAVIAAGAVTKLKKPRVLMPPRPGGAKLRRNWRCWTGARYDDAEETLLLPVGHRTSVALEAEFWAVIDEARPKQASAWRRWWPKSMQRAASGRWPARCRLYALAAKGS